jgi:hypothetical protein
MDPHLNTSLGHTGNTQMFYAIAKLFRILNILGLDFSDAFGIGLFKL